MIGLMKSFHARLFPFAALFVALLALFFMNGGNLPGISRTQRNAEAEEAFVERAIDGDTIELSDGRRVRYIGIDTPESVKPDTPVECFGKEASGRNRELVEGKTVRLVKDVSETDTYGRLLRYVYIGNTFVNRTLVEEGYAHAITIPPDVSLTDELRAAERNARERNVGLWSMCKNEDDRIIAPAEEPSCPIKGNINEAGEKIYHVPGCDYYERTVVDEAKGERWFCSEDEARSAGWRKAGNCPL